MRITLLGSYSNGKTTLARKIAEKYCLTLIPEVARVILSEYETSLKELRKDVEQVNEFQKEVFLRQKSYEEQYKDNYVSSRGIDNIIFFAQYGNKLNELVESKEFKEYINWCRGTIIFLVHPHKEMLVEDGLRDVNYEESLQLFGMIKFILEYHGLKYWEVTEINEASRERLIFGILEMIIKNEMKASCLQ